MWEDVKHGLIYGSQNFVADLKARFLDGKKDEELPQRNLLLRPVDPQLFWHFIRCKILNGQQSCQHLWGASSG